MIGRGCTVSWMTDCRASFQTEGSFLYGNFIRLPSLRVLYFGVLNLRITCFASLVLVGRAAILLMGVHFTKFSDTVVNWRVSTKHAAQSTFLQGVSKKQVGCGGVLLMQSAAGVLDFL